MIYEVEISIYTRPEDTVTLSFSLSGVYLEPEEETQARLNELLSRWGEDCSRRQQTPRIEDIPKGLWDEYGLSQVKIIKKKKICYGEFPGVRK